MQLSLARLRGGAVAHEHFVHAVVLGLVANSFAVVLCTACDRINASALRRVTAEAPVLSRLGTTGTAVLRHVLGPAVKLLAAFAAYYVVYVATGFVPMGFVAGSSPLLKSFAQCGDGCRKL